MQLLSLSTRFPKLAISFLIIVTGFYAYHLKDFEIDYSASKLLVKGDPERAYYEKTVEKFVSDNITSIAFVDDSLFTKEKLNLISDLVWELETWKEVDKVESLFNTKHIELKEGTLETVPILDTIPESEEEIKLIPKRALKNPIFKKTLISEDSKILTVNIYLKKDFVDKKFEVKFVNRLQPYLDKLDGSFQDVLHVGTPKLAKEVSNGIINDQKLAIPLAIITIVFLLFFFFKTPWAGLIPMFAGVLSILWTYGHMALIGIPGQMLTMGIPVLLIVVGSTEDSHIIAEYFEALRHKKQDRKLAINYLSHKISLAVILTTFTTFFGFLTISLQKIELLKEFGIACSIGIILNSIITVTLVPLLVKRFVKEPAKEDPEKGDLYHHIADKIFYFIKRHKVKILWLLFVIASSSAYFAKDIKVDNNSLANLKDSSEIKQDLRAINNKVGGVFSIFVTLHTPQDKGFKLQDNIRRIFEIESLQKKYPQFVSSQSYASTLALINREMTSGAERDFNIPSNQSLIEQYFLLLSPDDLRSYVTLDFKEANVIFRHSISSTHDTIGLVESLESDIQKILAGSEISYKLTGRRVLTDKYSTTIVEAQVESLVLILFMVLFVVGILFFDLKIALLALIPNFLPIFVMFGVMGLFDIPLDIGTCNVAAGAVGIAIDDTLHFFSRIKQNFKTYFYQEETILQTLREEIRPVFSTSISLALGLSILGFSSFVPIIKLGLFTALVLVVAFLADIIITPILMFYIDDKKFVSLYEQVVYRIKPLVFKNSRFLETFSIHDAKKLILLGRTIKLEKDERLFQEDLNKNCYLLLDGEMGLRKVSSRRGEEEKIIDLNTLFPGSLVGQIDNQPELNPDSFAQANNSCKLLIINSKFIEKAKIEYPHLSEGIDSYFQITNAQIS